MCAAADSILTAAFAVSASSLAVLTQRNPPDKDAAEPASASSARQDATVAATSAGKAEMAAGLVPMWPHPSGWPRASARPLENTSMQGRRFGQQEDPSEGPLLQCSIERCASISPMLSGAARSIFVCSS